MLTVRESRLLLALVDAVTGSADNTGCSDDLTVVSSAALEKLEARRPLLARACHHPKTAIKRTQHR